MRTSPIWGMDSKEFSALIRASNSSGEALAAFGFKNTGGQGRILYQRIREEGLDVSHFERNGGLVVKRCGLQKCVPIQEILVNGSTFNRGHMKRRLLDDGLLINECSCCGQKPEWNGEKLVMVIDHINGKRNDNRLENLRLLCPNCNSQMNTFAGRNKKCG